RARSPRPTRRSPALAAPPPGGAQPAPRRGRASDRGALDTDERRRYRLRRPQASSGSSLRLLRSRGRDQGHESARRGAPMRKVEVTIVGDAPEEAIKRAYLMMD